MKKRVEKTNQSVNFNHQSENDIDDYVDRYMAVSRYISNFIKGNCIRQKEFALKLDKSESEISKWLSGSHNLTLKSILKLESACNIEILNPSIWRQSNLVQSVVASTSIESVGELHNTFSIHFTSTRTRFSAQLSLKDIPTSSNTTTQKASNPIYEMAA